MQGNTVGKVINLVTATCSLSRDNRVERRFFNLIKKD